MRWSFHSTQNLYLSCANYTLAFRGDDMLQCFCRDFFICWNLNYSHLPRRKTHPTKQLINSSSDISVKQIRCVCMSLWEALHFNFAVWPTCSSTDNESVSVVIAKELWQCSNIRLINHSLSKLAAKNDFNVFLIQ